MSTAALRIFATNDMGAALVPVATTSGPGGTCAGLAALRAGSVTELDLLRLFDRADDVVVAEPEPAGIGARAALARMLAS